MTCKKIERLILESAERPLDERERKELEIHLRSCAGCRAFEAGRRAAREAALGLGRAELPEALDLRTRRLCLEALGSVSAERRLGAGRARIPVPVVVVSTLFAILAAVYLTASLVDVTPGAALPSGAWGAIVVIAQNVLMLFLSPVILRALRPSEDSRPSFR